MLHSEGMLGLVTTFALPLVSLMIKMLFGSNLQNFIKLELKVNNNKASQCEGECEEEEEVEVEEEE